jgi:AcrR family transcriptional regulator
MADQTAPKKRAKSERTKERLYHTAMEMLIERGFQATTIRDICKQANVSVGTFYSYFDSKNSILFEVVRKIDHYFVDEVQPRLEDKPCKDQILEYFTEYGTYLEHMNFETVCVLYNVENIWVVRYRPLHRVLTSILTTGQLNGEVTRDMTAEQLCEYLFMGVRGIAFSWCAVKASFSITERITDYMNLALKGILTSPEQV